MRANQTFRSRIGPFYETKSGIGEEMPGIFRASFRSRDSRRRKAGKSMPLSNGSAVTAITDTVSCLLTGRNVSARSSFPIPCSASDSVSPYFPATSCSMRSFIRPRTGRSVPSAARFLLQSQIMSNTARTAGSVSRTGRQRSA